MFGGSGGFAGGYGGSGGIIQSHPESEADRHNAFAGGSFENGNQDARNFNTVVSGGGFGGSGYGAATNVQASQGLGGYLKAPGQTDNVDGPRLQGGQRDQQSLMPLTIRMILDAQERMEQTGPDAPLIVNGKECFVFTFVACLESIELETVYRLFKVNDGTGKATVKKYSDSQPGQDADLQVGEYVRVFGSLRLWNGGFHISAHHVGRLDNPNEVSFHFIEVAHVHLSLAGRIQTKAAPPVGAQGSSGLGLSSTYGGGMISMGSGQVQRFEPF
mmetsp:Transcript_125200/g.196189  ORF Transcript_125200/g.196189 Transcript_125200/m.196189 type:complete len:273 (-) Transcript_125200:40-858(-)